MYSIQIGKIGQFAANDLPPVEVHNTPGKKISPLILVGIGLLLYMAIKK